MAEVILEELQTEVLALIPSLHVEKCAQLL